MEQSQINFVKEYHNAVMQRQIKKLKIIQHPNVLKDFEVVSKIDTYDFSCGGYLTTLKWLFAEGYSYIQFEQTSLFVKSLIGRNKDLIKVEEPNLVLINGKRINDKKFGKLTLFVKNNELFGFIDRDFKDEQTMVDKFIYVGRISVEEK